nr:hypothetical protein CFP56_11230 [Quercus suber]
MALSVHLDLCQLAITDEMNGYLVLPSEFSMILGDLPSMTATAELVVPKSIPMTWPLTFSPSLTFSAYPLRNCDVMGARMADDLSVDVARDNDDDGGWEANEESMEMEEMMLQRSVRPAKNSALTRLGLGKRPRSSTFGECPRRIRGRISHVNIESESPQSFAHSRHSSLDVRS